MEKRFITNDITYLDNKKIAFKVKSMDQEYSFTIEQILAYYFTKLRKFYEKSEIACKEIVLSIPSYCSNVERQSLLDAAQIAGLKCQRVINESTALALQYGFFRKRDLDPKEERIVAFVDYGHSKTTITIAGFLQDQTRVICHKSDRNLGAREWDWDISKIIGAEFEKKFGDNPMDNKRCIVRMLEGVEKARKMLSSVSDAQISIDYLLNEEDLTRIIKKDEFEAIIEPYIKRFSRLVNDTILLSGLTAD